MSIYRNILLVEFLNSAYLPASTLYGLPWRRKHCDRVDEHFCIIHFRRRSFHRHRPCALASQTTPTNAPRNSQTVPSALKLHLCGSVVSSRAEHDTYCPSLPWLWDFVLVLPCVMLVFWLVPMQANYQALVSAMIQLMMLSWLLKSSRSWRRFSECATLSAQCAGHARGGTGRRRHF